MDNSFSYWLWRYSIKFAKIVGPVIFGKNAPPSGKLFPPLSGYG